MILVIGGHGMIGRALVRHASLVGLPCSHTSRNQDAPHHLDLAESPEKWQIPSGIESAIICASVTGIANCEAAPAATSKINVHACKELALRLSERGAKITFLSSSLVFTPGTMPPCEITKPNPSKEYGRQKLALENYLLSNFPDCRIIRPTKVISPSMPLFSKWIESIHHGQHIEAFSDLYFSPIGLNPVAACIMEIAQGKESGIFHLAASDSISYADAARWILARVGAAADLLCVIKAPSANTPNSARLACNRTIRLTSFEPVSSLQNLEEAWSHQK